jgi:GTP-binding protein EngB required for normal cell division
MAELLNSFQKNRLLVSLQYMDQLLGDIEAILSAAQSGSPFPKYRAPLSPVQARVVRDYISRIRAQMVRALEGLETASRRPRLDSTRSIRTTLLFISDAIEELRPRHLRGYGPVAEEAGPLLHGMVDELQGFVGKLSAYLSRDGDQDLQARLNRLEGSGEDKDLLAALDRIIAGHGLVEFRPALSMVLERMEEPAFEIAVFGRVSSGKSSLLNRLLETEALPVGVTPITAVPIRIQHGREPRLTVWQADRAPEHPEIARLADFATERGNPSNARLVTRIVLELPSPRLRQGAVFVDTPGLGSLATAGAAQTRVYLPHCDLGVVLIDAGASLSPEDISVIQALYEAGVPAQVLLSKADLLGGRDRAAVLEYVHAQIQSELGLNLPVHPVTVMEEHGALVDHWFHAEITPLYAQQQELLRRSLRRKIGAVREGVEAALRVRVERRKESPGQVTDYRKAEAELRRASGKLAEARSRCQQIAANTAGRAASALRAAVEECLDQAEWQPAVVLPERLAQSAAEQAQALREEVETAAKDLSHALARAAQHLDQPLPEGPAELVERLPDLPRLEVEPERLDLPRPSLRIFGRGAAGWQARRRLRIAAEPLAEQWFEQYGRVLEHWAETALAEVQRRFDAGADTFRAQLARLTSEGGGPGQDAAALRDLEELARWRGSVQEVAR